MEPTEASIEIKVRLSKSEINRLIGHDIQELESLRAQVGWLKDLMGIQVKSVPSEWGLTSAQGLIAAALLTRKGPVSRTHIVAILYPSKEPKCVEGIINVHIKRIRDKLRPFGISIKTIYGQGYYLDPPAKTIILQSLQNG